MEQINSDNYSLREDNTTQKLFDCQNRSIQCFFKRLFLLRLLRSSKQHISNINDFIKDQKARYSFAKQYAVNT
jgi:hypothetical protein